MLTGISLAALALALVAALAAAFVRGLAGFGMAILLVPVLGLAIPPGEAVVVGNWLGLLIGFTDVRRFIVHAEPDARLIALLAVLATPLGVFALAHTAPGLARLLIALVALAAFALFLLPQRAGEPGRFLTWATGLASGFLTGFAGMPGAPVAPYYLGRRMDRQVARASMLLIFFATSFAGIAASLALGLGTLREPVLAVLLYPAVLIGSWLGTRAFGHISPRAWRIFTGGVLGASALGALWKLLQTQAG